MDTYRLTKLANHIEKLEHGEGSFSMGAFFFKSPDHHSCGSPACIAGHAIAMFGAPSDFNQHNIRGDAQKLLGLDVTTASDLFYGVDDIDLDAITPKEAAEAIYKLVETGTVDWSHAECFREYNDEEDDND